MIFGVRVKSELKAQVEWPGLFLQAVIASSEWKSLTLDVNSSLTL